MKNKKVITNFGIINRRFISHTTKILDNQVISYSDSIFLVNIGEKEGITQDEISKNLSIDKAAITRSIKSMEKEGLVTQKSSELDKRYKELYLTSKGKELCNYIVSENAKYVDYVLHGISNEEIKIFEKIIKTIKIRSKDFL